MEKKNCCLESCCGVGALPDTLEKAHVEVKELRDKIHCMVHHSQEKGHNACGSNLKLESCGQCHGIQSCGSQCHCNNGCAHLCKC